MSETNVDLLDIVGLEHSTFYNSGEDITLKSDKKEEAYARVFKKGKRVVYRAGTLVRGDDTDDRRDH